MRNLRFDYVSPRWSQEILDCSMPMTFDTYSVCSFSCLYCFSFFQKSHSLRGYLSRDVRSVAPEKVMRLFDTALKGDIGRPVSEADKQFYPYIRDRYVMQWGALADQFDLFEKKYGISLKLMRYFDIVDYPLSFSTKGVWWTKDKRYMDLLEKHAHNWHFKVSIITANKEKARQMEPGVASPQERLKAIKRIAETGCPVTLRLRPYIIGLSDDYEELIRRAAKVGIDSVTTEFLCLEGRADERLKKRYAAMSKIVGYDLYDFYMKNSPQHGYKRLAAGIKRPQMRAMQNLTESLGLRFYVSDAAGRQYCHGSNCCGVPPEWKSQEAHFGKAVLIAQANGEVHFADIQKGIDKLFGKFEWIAAKHFNTGTNRARAKFWNISMAEWIRWVWNHPKAGASPYKMYGKILVPNGVDKNGDVVYRYVGK